MADPSLVLQKAQYDALRIAPAVAGGRIYDPVPKQPPTFPYLVIGEGDALGDDNECWGATEVNSQVHVWSRELGFTEAKAIAETVRARLSVPLTIAGFQVTSAEHVITRFLRDPDGLTSHAVVELRYLIDHDTP